MPSKPCAWTVALDDRSPKIRERLVKTGSRPGLQQTTLPSSPECWMKELSDGKHRSKMSAAILRRAPNMSTVATICTTWRTSSGRLPADVQTVPSDFRTARVASVPDSPGYSSSQRPQPITVLLHWNPCRRPSKP